MRNADSPERSESRYRALVDASPDATYVVRDGLILYVNPASVRLFGASSPEQLLGTEILDRVHPDCRAVALARRAAIAKGSIVAPRDEMRFVRLDGAVIDVDVAATAIVFDEVPAIHVVVRDISERKQGEDALRRRTRELATLFEVSRSLSATLDLQTVMQTATNQIAELSELKTAAVYLLTGDMLRLWATTPPLPPDFPEALRLAPLADHPHVLEAITTRQPVFLADAQAVELTPAEHDVTVRRNLRSILYLPLQGGASVLGVLIVSSLGEPRVVSAAETELCQTLANLAAMATVNAQLYEASLAYGAELEQEIQERNRTEQEQVRLNAQLQQAQKMESVGRLAGGVAHDFNNMLGVILGNVDLALAQVDTESPLRTDLEEIRDATLRSVELTRQLLAFARKQTVSPKVLDLNETVAGMLKMLQRLIGEDIDLRWSPAQVLWPVRIDPSQVDQVLANLCVNARDAIAGTGKLSIETGHRTFTLNDCLSRPEFVPGEYVMLAVSDDGAGMDAHTLSHLFEPFFTTKTLGKGTGLGLATVYGVVRQNGGFIDVYSEPSHGTTFKIYLPRHTGRPAREPVTDPLRVAQRGHETLLVAEDEPGILALTVRLLALHGYTVLRAATPGEAIRMAADYPGNIALLITDVVMPEMNGRELAKRLQTLHPLMKCLFMSGYTADVIAHRGALDEGVHFIQKPFSHETLMQGVRDALDA